jgi:hypothetical protein
VTDPVNPNFTPQSKTEFGIAVNQLIKNLPDTDMPELYDTVKAAIKDKAKKENEENMNKKTSQSKTTQVETAVRQVVRKMLEDMNPRFTPNLSEAKPFDWKNAPPVTGPLPPVKKIPAGIHGSEYMRRIEKNKADLKRSLGKAATAIDAPITDDEFGIEPESPELTMSDKPKHRAYKSTALGSMSDVGGKSFEDIAKELNFSVAGAKQAVDKALEKAKFLAQNISEDDLEIMILSAINDYIKYLTKSGELTAADVQLMKDHPDIVRELDGFREFLHNYIRRARKANQRLYNPVKDDEPTSDRDLNLKDDDEEVTSTDVASATTAAAPARLGAAKKAGKTLYKIYKGGNRYGGAPVVTRYKGKVYAPSGETLFSPNERGVVTPSEDGKLLVKKQNNDHVQSWDPVDEGSRPILRLK